MHLRVDMNFLDPSSLIETEKSGLEIDLGYGCGLPMTVRIFWHFSSFYGCKRIPKNGEFLITDGFTRCSFIPASIWAKNQLLTPYIDQELAFSMDPLGTYPLKTPVAVTFVNFLWPSTPPYANIRILAVDSGHTCWAKPISGSPQY